ncbi:MAG: nicotinate (nicotinamide) nucleotide adenylyltransferase [Sphaerochaeta sp.]|nr:nicotinate (nicotinamide) nucleotide adenylyltransferase [Sphaerochaeta sp.]
MTQAVPTAMVGGSFDPVHLGHLHLVHTVATTTPYRRFIFVPVARNNFKQEARTADAEHRMRMLTLGFASYREYYPDDPELEFVFDECELKRGGISYTYDTVKHLYLHYPIKGRLAVVMGDDLVQSLDKWHAYEQLKELVSFVVIRRNSLQSSFADPGADLQYLDNPLLEDSSTRIREALMALDEGQSLSAEIASLMPEEVASYVQDHRLYRTRS